MSEPSPFAVTISALTQEPAAGAPAILGVPGHADRYRVVSTIGDRRHRRAVERDRTRKK